MRLDVWDIDKKTGIERCMISVESWQIPEGGILRECYETETEVIVLGWPRDSVLGEPGVDSDHNCDQMGCSTVSHVLYRFKKEKS